VQSYPENEGSKFFRNVGNILPDYTASQFQPAVIFIATAARTSNLMTLTAITERLGGGGAYRKPSGKYFGLEAI
jgi:hypothetical protein